METERRTETERSFGARNLKMITYLLDLYPGPFGLGPEEKGSGPSSSSSSSDLSSSSSFAFLLWHSFLRCWSYSALLLRRLLHSPAFSSIFRFF